MKADVYIETSISWSKVSDGVVGIAITIDNPENAKTLFGKVTQCSESAAVLYGFKNALDRITRCDEICLNISCGSVAAAFQNGWIYKWQTDEFKDSKGKEIKNRDIWEDILKMLNGRKVNIKYKEFNGYRTWLKSECARRAQKYVS